MGLLDATYTTVNSKKPRNSDRIQPGQEMNIRGLLDAATNIPVVGDALSGGMAVYDAAKGDYGSAAVNALGVLPFVSAAPLAMMAGINKAAKAKGVSTEAGKLAQAMPNQAGAIVWHGSPHKFDKFDMSKIGTGEGAQAYGHGLYMAEKPGVAASYKTFDPREWWVGDQKIDPKSLKGADKQAWNVATLAKTNNQDPMEYAAKLMNEGKMSLAQYGRVSKFSNAELRDPTGGNMYKVDIPDEAVARFLDWDKPLSQQAHVADAFKSYLSSTQLSPDRAFDLIKDRTAGEAYQTISGRNPHWISEALAENGIPGIRYLDGGSRSAGQGSSNFVLFDDQMPRILEVNGNPTGLQPWGKGEWNGLLGK